MSDDVVTRGQLQRALNELSEAVSEEVERAVTVALERLAGNVDAALASQDKRTRADVTAAFEDFAQQVNHALRCVPQRGGGTPPVIDLSTLPQPVVHNWLPHPQSTRKKVRHDSDGNIVEVIEEPIPPK